MTWTNIWVVGNGPSAQDIPVSFWKDKNVLVINNALFRVPNAGALFSLDVNWIRKHRTAIFRFPGEKYLSLPNPNQDGCMDLPGVKYSLWGYGKGLSNDPEHIKTGCNSGYAALNLAYLKGSQEIHLIGYDMNPADNDQYQFWAPLFLVLTPVPESL